MPFKVDFQDGIYKSSALQRLSCGTQFAINFSYSTELLKSLTGINKG